MSLYIYYKIYFYNKNIFMELAQDSARNHVQAPDFWRNLEHFSKNNNI